MGTDQTWVLTDREQDIWVDKLELDAEALGLASDSGVAIRKHTCRGGLSDGVDMIEVENGPLRYAILPTRGMGLWCGEYRGLRLGWSSPVQGPVHPAFVNLTERGGLGWLAGFDEWIVRCGLESNGPPVNDVVPSNTGAPTSTPFGLHGRIANIPAHHVEVAVENGASPALTVSGVVDERVLFGPQLRLYSSISTTPGSNAIRFAERVINLGGTDAELELLYHCNFGSPLLEEGSKLLLPARTTMPRGVRAVEEWQRWDTYHAPQAGFTEQCYWHVPLGDADGNTLAMLTNADDTVAAVIRFNVGQLPCFTQWKHTAAHSEGYVTGLEPATDYPNSKTFERANGRVLKLAPGAELAVDLQVEVLDSPEAVAACKREVATIQGDTEHKVFAEPQAGYSDLA